MKKGSFTDVPTKIIILCEEHSSLGVIHELHLT